MFKGFLKLETVVHTLLNEKPMKSINEKLLQSLLPGKIIAVQIGISRVAVLVETDDGMRCGLAATLSNPDYENQKRPYVRNAGHLHKMSYFDLAGMVESASYTEVAIGLATINALLPRDPSQWIDLNAVDYLIRNGKGKKVAVVGHFPFVDRLRRIAKELWVLELNPKDGDLPAHVAPEIIPQADLVAITATTMVNKTFNGLIDLCRPEEKVILLGPSTPLSPVMYEYRIDLLSGTIVEDFDAAFIGISQGISFHQLRQNGAVRLVTMQRGA